MIYSTTNRSISRRGLKNTKRTCAHVSNMYKFFIIDRSISYSDSSLSSDIKLYERKQPAECKETHKLYHVVINIIKKKNQRDDGIEYGWKFENKFSLSSGPNEDPLSIVIVRLRGGN